MLAQVVVKLNRACNLRCSYCYYINENTHSPGMRMEWDVLQTFLDKYTAYCAEEKIAGTVAFHGGEPLLLGKPLFRRALEHPGFARGHLRPSLQTNGILLDKEWIDLFRAHSVALGISLDGPPAVHDSRRFTANGTGSYDLVLRGIRLLQAGQMSFVVLCVVDPTANGEAVFNHLVELGLRKIDFLPPISNHARQTRTPVDLAGIDDFLASAFVAWLMRGDPRIEVRLFCELLWRYTHNTSGYAAIGMEHWDSVGVLETDGVFARTEEFAEADAFDGGRRYLTDKHILRHGIKEIADALRLDAAGIDCIGLPDACRKCPMNDVCLGGNIATRFDANGSFNNPGVHCRSWFRLASLIKRAVDASA